MHFGRCGVFRAVGEQADRLGLQKIFLEDNLNWMSSSLFMELFALGKSSASAMLRAARRPGCIETLGGHGDALTA